MSKKPPARGFAIAGRPIGPEAAPFVIAEMSGNHNHSLERALQIVDAAAKAGAHGFKIQTYTADSMTLDLDSGDFRIDDPKSLWDGRTLYSLYAEAATPYEWHEPIFERARKHGMIPFSTPFDEAAVDFLEKLGSACYKVASFENTDLPLVRRIARTGKPMIISTGMATVSELEETVREARAAGCRDLVLLKCTSTYPAKPRNTNLMTIPHMRELFECEVGLSDHTMGVGAAVASVALGATVIEKHFTLARADGGVDSAFSLEPAEMEALVVETERAWQALGEIQYGATADEKASLQFRRSLYVGEDIAAGQPFTERNLRRIRPGHGLPCRHYDFLLGKVLVRPVKKGEPVSWDMVFPQR